MDKLLPNSKAPSDVPDTFEPLLDDAAPTLLDFLDSLDGNESFDVEPNLLPAYRPLISSVKMKAPEKKLKTRTKSNTWRQRQRLEVLRLREEVKQLDEELKKAKLAAGVRSTLPLIKGVRRVVAAQINSSALKKFLGESWQDAASRESLARQMADVENERLHNVLLMQVKHARKLHRMMTEQMTTTVVAQALGCRPAITGDEGCPPKDNNVVFQKLLAALDGHCGDTRAKAIAEFNKKDGHVSINHARGLQVHIVNSYTVPFSAEATEQVVWNVLAEKEDSNMRSRVAYNELFEVDRTTILQSIRMFIVAGSLELCFLVRKGCRKHVTDGQTNFVVHEMSIVNTSFGAGVSYSEVVWRAVQQGKERAGSPTSTIETHVEATFPSYKTLNCLPPEGLKGFHDSLMRFNHKVEDLLVNNDTSCVQPRT